MEINNDSSIFSKIFNLTQSVRKGEITYEDYASLLDSNYSIDTLRKFSYVFSEIFSNIDQENIDLSTELKDLKEEIIKERQKLQLVRTDYNASIRYDARKELFNEMVLDSINKLKPIEVKKTVFSNRTPEKTGVLFISDEHYGKDFKLYGFYNEVVNEYSPKIFKERMWNLLSKINNDIFDMGYEKLIVCDLGDNIEGILRATNSLRKLTVGVVDSIIEYSEFISIWLNELSQRLEIPIEYHLNGGNHDILRILNSKPDFDEENVGKLINHYIKLRLKDNKNILIGSYSDIGCHNLYGVNMLTYHGADKDLSSEISFFENYYQLDIDLLVCGHLHTEKEIALGSGYLGNRLGIVCPSIMGPDDYSKKIRKTSRPGAKFILFSEDGIDLEKTYYL